jgi:hypothetical protein
MLTYYLGGYNDYTIRTKQICSGSNYLRVTLQNMMTQDNYSFINGPGQWSYNECESIVSMSFNLSISSNSIVGDQYRLYLTPAISNSTTPFTYCEDVWHGSLAVFTSQSIDKPGYVNQIPESETFISRDSTNEYIVWSQAAPATTTTTTTIAPTTTTTTIGPTTTTTSTTTDAPQFVRIYLASENVVPADVILWYRTGTPNFIDLGFKTPGVYPNYTLAQTLFIPPSENLRFGVTNAASASILFGTGSNSGQFTTNCGITNPTLIPQSSWSGSIDVYLNIDTNAGNYVLC